MTAPERVVLLVGSGKAPAAADVGTDQPLVRPPRRGQAAQGSTSEALGAYLLNALGRLGLACETLRVQRCLRSEEARRGMLAAVREGSLVLLSFPLYWDALPAALTRSLELISEDRRSNPPVRTQRLAAIVNCGFPEASRCEAALAICRQFARETGLVWAGGLALGGGGTISGRHLEKLGRRIRHVAHALELSAAALVAGQPVPPAAARLMARPIVPPFAYRFVGNMLWRWHAKAFGAYSRLHDRPYER
jgi:hypothetical protein